MSWRRAASAELRRSLAGPLAAYAMTRALGLEPEEVAAVLAWYDAIVSAVTEITAGSDVPAAGRTAGSEVPAAGRRRSPPCANGCSR